MMPRSARTRRAASPWRRPLTQAERSAKLITWLFWCAPSKLAEATAEGLSAEHGVEIEVVRAELAKARRIRNREGEE